MKNLRKLERDFARADLATVTGLLSRLDDEDVMTRFGLEARRDELKNVIADLDQRVDEPVVSAALFLVASLSSAIKASRAGSQLRPWRDSRT